MTECADLRATVSSLRDEIRLLTEAIPRIVWTARPDGSVDHCNQRWCAYTGMTVADTVDHGWITALHPDDVPIYRDRWADVVRAGETDDSAYRLRRASDGAYRWHRIRALPLRNEAGDIVKWYGTWTDIDDETRQAADDVSANERRLQALVDNAPVVLMAFDHDGVITTAEGGGVDRLWAIPRQAIGSRFAAHFGDRLEVQDCVRRVLAGAPCISTVDCGEAVFITRYTPLVAADGAVSGGIAVTADVTDGVRVEEQRRAVEERDRLLADNATDLISRHGPDGAYIYGLVKK